MEESTRSKWVKIEFWSQIEAVQVQEAAAKGQDRMFWNYLRLDLDVAEWVKLGIYFKDTEGDEWGL